MFKRTACFAFAALMISGSAFADTISDGDYSAVEKFQGLNLNFEFLKMPKGLNNVVLYVTGPKDYAAAVKSGAKAPSMDLKKFGDVADGVYSYEIGGGTGEKFALNKSQIQNNGRESGPSEVRYGTFAMNGHFVVKKGVIFIADPDAIDKTDPVKGDNSLAKETDKGEVGTRTEESGQIGKPEEPKDGDKG